jgi:phosphotransferase system HPr (HPr) family protein
MVTIRLKIEAAEGLHARPASIFCSTANKFNSDIMVRNATTGSEFVNAKSILRILTLGVACGNTVELQASGDDEKDAIEEIRVLVESNFPH